MVLIAVFATIHFIGILWYRNSVVKCIKLQCYSPANVGANTQMCNKKYMNI